MRRRLVSGLALTVLAAVAAAGCSDNNTPTTPTTPSAPTVVETFSGTLTVNGGLTFPFVVSTPGIITGTLKSLVSTDPAVSSPTVGIAVGLYSGTSCQMVPGIANDAAGAGSSVTGVMNASGSLCARVFDASGTLTAPVTFEFEVAHF